MNFFRLSINACTVACILLFVSSCSQVVDQNVSGADKTVIQTPTGEKQFTDREIQEFDAIAPDAQEIMSLDDSEILASRDLSTDNSGDPPKVKALKQLLKSKFGDDYTKYYIQGDLQPTSSRTWADGINLGPYKVMTESGMVNLTLVMQGFYIRLPWGSYCWNNVNLYEGLRQENVYSALSTDLVYKGSPKKSIMTQAYNITLTGDLVPGFFPHIDGLIFANFGIGNKLLWQFFPNGVAIAPTQLWTMP